MTEVYCNDCQLYLGFDVPDQICDKRRGCTRSMPCKVCSTPTGFPTEYCGLTFCINSLPPNANELRLEKDTK